MTVLAIVVGSPPPPPSVCTGSGLSDAARERGRADALVSESCERSLEGSGRVEFPPPPEPPAPPRPFCTPGLSSRGTAGRGERGRDRGSWAPAIGRGCG